MKFDLPEVTSEEKSVVDGIYSIIYKYADGSVGVKPEHNDDLVRTTKNGDKMFYHKGIVERIERKNGDVKIYYPNGNINNIHYKDGNIQYFFDDENNRKALSVNPDGKCTFYFNDEKNLSYVEFNENNVKYTAKCMFYSDYSRKFLYTYNSYYSPRSIVDALEGKSEVGIYSDLGDFFGRRRNSADRLLEELKIKLSQQSEYKKYYNDDKHTLKEELLATGWEKYDQDGKLIYSEKKGAKFDKDGNVSGLIIDGMEINFKDGKVENRLIETPKRKVLLNDEGAIFAYEREGNFYWGDGTLLCAAKPKNFNNKDYLYSIHLKYGHTIRAKVNVNHLENYFHLTEEGCEWRHLHGYGAYGIIKIDGSAEGQEDNIFPWQQDKDGNFYELREWGMATAQITSPEGLTWKNPCSENLRDFRFTKKNGIEIEGYDEKGFKHTCDKKGHIVVYYPDGKIYEESNLRNNKCIKYGRNGNIYYQRDADAKYIKEMSSFAQTRTYYEYIEGERSGDYFSETKPQCEDIFNFKDKFTGKEYHAEIFEVPYCPNFVTWDKQEIRHGHVHKRYNYDDVTGNLTDIEYFEVGVTRDNNHFWGINRRLFRKDKFDEKGNIICSLYGETGRKEDNWNTDDFKVNEAYFYDEKTHKVTSRRTYKDGNETSYTHFDENGKDDTKAFLRNKARRDELRKIVAEKIDERDAKNPNVKKERVIKNKTLTKLKIALKARRAKED